MITMVPLLQARLRQLPAPHRTPGSLRSRSTHTHRERERRFPILKQRTLLRLMYIAKTLISPLFYRFLSPFVGIVRATDRVTMSHVPPVPSAICAPEHT